MVQNLSDAISAAVEKSPAVRESIEILREMGYEPNLLLKLEINLQEIDDGGFIEETKLNLTDEDVRTLRRMKIRF